MTNYQEKELIRLHEEGKSSKEIAAMMGIKPATVRSFFSRKKHRMYPDEDSSNRSLCECCHKPMPEQRYKRQRRFCSDLCRSRWWNAHRDKLNNADSHYITCGTCGVSFFSYTPAKYCSRACYFTARKDGKVYHG